MTRIIRLSGCTPWSPLVWFFVSREMPWSAASNLKLASAVIVGTLSGLFFFHRKTREKNQVKLENYYNEQVCAVCSP